MFYIEEGLKEALSAQGFNSYKSFIKYKGGLRVSRKSKRDVRTIELLVGGMKKNYFIKLARVEPFKRVWQSIRNGKFPHSKVLKEIRMLKFFEEQNIPVMRAMAWGERRVFGWPVSGFLLLEEVKGREFVELFKTSGSRVRRQMMRVYGSLVGHVHKKGINAKVRPRDIICVSDDLSDYSKAFVLIDRERGNPFPVNMPMKKCAAQLATLLTKSIQNIGMPEKGELLAFLDGYFSGNHAFYEKRNEFVSITSDRIKQLMYNQERYKEIREKLISKYQLQ